MEFCGRRFCQSAGSSLAFWSDRVDVGGQRQRHDIGLEPVDHGARLGARAAMRRVDRDVSPVFCFHCAAKAALMSL